MIIVKLYGGLGNQMFQYAAARACGERLQTDVAFDDEYFLHPDRFGSAWPYQLDLLKTQIQKWHSKVPKAAFDPVFRLIRRLNRAGLPTPGFFFEKPSQYDERINALSENTFLDGYFQSEKYFKSIRGQLLNELAPKADWGSANEQMARKMAESESVSLHVRRGDYVSNPAAARVHGTCDLAYYQRAIEHFEARLKAPTFFVFSDDPDWVKANIRPSSSSDVVYVNQNSGLTSYFDIFLMSRCQHNIIANSSFSWWGAWLNTSANQEVVAPARWYSDIRINTGDIYPETWLKF